MAVPGAEDVYLTVSSRPLVPAPVCLFTGSLTRPLHDSSY
jgi:hypothetical protein